MSYIQSKISTNTYVDERDTDTHIYVPLQVKQQLASPFLLCETRNDLEQIRSMVCLPWMPSQKDLLDFHLNVYECLFYCSLFFILFKALVSLLSFHSQQYILTLQELAALYKQKARFRIILLLMSPQSYYHHPPTWPK